MKSKISQLQEGRVPEGRKLGTSDLPSRGDNLASSMSSILSELFACRMKAQVYHWNFTGSKFYGVHKLLQEIYEKWDLYIDDVAERIRTLGGRPVSSFLEIDRQANVSNSIHDKNLQPELMVQDMITSLSQLNDELKVSIRFYGENDDPVSEDLMIQILGSSEKFRWMLESFHE